MNEQRVAKAACMLKSVLRCQPCQKFFCNKNTFIHVVREVWYRIIKRSVPPKLSCQVLLADTELAGIRITWHNLLPTRGSSVHASVNWAGCVFVFLLLLCDEEQSGPCCCCWWWWRSLYFANLHLIWRTSLGDHRYLPTPTEDTSATNGSV
jgi:hypothetical protein